MKTNVILGLMLFSVAFISCRKKDIQPVISINGAYEQTISLGETYVELGATAKDNKDGDLSSDVTISGAVDNTQVGEYRIFYDVKDSEGNKAATAKRYVKVVNDANYMIGTYAATPTCSGSGTSSTVYNTNITVSQNNNNQIFISSVLYHVNNAPITANISGTTITIPLQTIGTHTVTGTGTITGGNFVLSVVIDFGISYDCTISHLEL